MMITMVIIMMLMMIIKDIRHKGPETFMNVWLLCARKFSCRLRGDTELSSRSKFTFFFRIFQFFLDFV